MAASRTRIALGDFQTPAALAEAICARLADDGLRPAAVLEPTCGEGAFLAAAARCFPGVKALAGVDINPAHLATARAHLAAVSATVTLETGDFFTHDWPALLARLPRPLLMLGNPPWVTSAGLGRAGAGNLPPKRNDARLRGVMALTGTSNFDICEWMIARMFEWPTADWVAMLCKTQVARRLLRGSSPLTRPARLHRIDAMAHFGVAADAGLLIAGPRTTTTADPRWPVYPDLAATRPEHTLGLRAGQLVQDPDLHDRLAHLRGPGAQRWRSGVKHDNARVLEMVRDDQGWLRNGLGEIVDIEPLCVYPLLKGADLHAGRTAGQRFLLVPQRHTGEDPERLSASAPRTYAYLQRHAARFAARRSRIYRGRARFSVFGVGPYTFSPWKVAVAGLYKRFAFRVIGPHEDRPVVLDDTSYFLACDSAEEAQDRLARLQHPDATAFLHTLVFWDSKRPVTARLLDQLALDRVDLSRRPGRAAGEGNENGSPRALGFR